jgi:predicted membrane metal-binding protein
MGFYVDLTRFAVAFVLSFAAVAKLVGAGEFRDTLARTQLVPQTLVRPLVVAIPLLELGAAAALILSPLLGAATTIVLLAAFSAAAEAVHRRGRVVRCNCFAGVADGRLGRQTALRNLVLVAFSIVVVVRPPSLTTASLPLGLTGVALAAMALLVLSTFGQATQSRASLLAIGVGKTRTQEDARRRAA